MLALSGFSRFCPAQNQLLQRVGHLRPERIIVRCNVHFKLVHNAAKLLIPFGYGPHRFCSGASDVHARKICSELEAPRPSCEAAERFYNTFLQKTNVLTQADLVLIVK